MDGKQGAAAKRVRLRQRHGDFIFIRHTYIGQVVCSFVIF